MKTLNRHITKRQLCTPYIIWFTQTSRAITVGEQGCALSMEASTTGNVWCLDIRSLASGAVVILAK